MSLAIPILEPAFRSLNGWIADMKYGLESYIAADKRVKQETVIDSQLVADLCPVNFKPSPDGMFLESNGTFIQCITIADPSPVNPNKQGLPENITNLNLIDDILALPIHKDTIIEICHICIPLPPNDENDSMEDARRETIVNSALEESQDPSVVKTHSKLNDFVLTSIENQHLQVYKGEEKTYEFSLIAAVQGTSKKAVSATMDLIEGLCDQKKVIKEIPQHGMVDVFMSMMPTPYIAQRLLSEQAGSKVAATCPLRNPNATLADHGRFMGINTDTLCPIYLNYHDDSLVNGHGLVVGKSGSGKSVVLLVDDIRALADGDMVLHIVPKKDGKTDHIRVCAAMNGRLFKIGHGGNNFNIMQIFFDPTHMQDSWEAHQNAYSDHVSALVDSLGICVGDGYSDPQKNQLYNSVVAFYKKERELDGRLYRFVDENNRVIPENFDLWSNEKAFDIFDGLAEIWDTWIKDGKHNHEKSALKALYNNTSMLRSDGIYGDIFCCQKGLDLDNNYLMFDLSSLAATPNIQDAISLLICRIIKVKISSLKPEYDGRRLFITLDEGSNLIKNPRLRDIIETLFREIRSFGGHVKIVFQDLAGIPRDMLDMLKTNTDYTLLLSNLSGSSIKPLRKEFGLDVKDVKQLRKKGKGVGLFMYGDTHINYYNDLTDKEKEFLFAKTPLNDEGKTEQPAPVQEPEINAPWKIADEYKWMLGKPGIVNKAWFMKLNDRTIPGFAGNITTFDPLTGKRVSIMVKAGLINEEGKIKNQLTDHYYTVSLLGGDLGAMTITEEVSFDDYGTDDSQEADVKWKISILQPDGTVIKKTIGFEYQTKESHASKAQLIKKRERLLSKKVNGQHVYDHVIFFANSDYYPFILDAVGDDYAAQRGQILAEKIDQYIEKVKTYKPVRMSDPLAESEPENAPLDSAL